MRNMRGEMRVYSYLCVWMEGSPCVCTNNSGKGLGFVREIIGSEHVTF